MEHYGGRLRTLVLHIRMEKDLRTRSAMGNEWGHLGISGGGRRAWHAW